MILLSAQGITKHFGATTVLDGVALELRPGERLGLVGPNGAGKSTLLGILARRLDPDGGRIDLHRSARVGYLEQQPEFPPGRTTWQVAESALESVVELQRDLERLAAAIAETDDAGERARLSRRYDHLQHQLEEQDAYHLEHRIERVLEGLGLGRELYALEATRLSGGQQGRLLLARLLLEEPDVLLLDEPSNHLDVEATEWLEGHLAQAPQAMIIVSHDRYFLDRVTTGTLELYAGTIDAYPGNFSAYWRQRAERQTVQARAYEKQQEYIARQEEFIRRNFYGQKAAQAKDREKKLERIERVAPPREIAGPPMGFPSATRTGDVVLRAENVAKSYARPLFRGLSFDVARGERWGILGPNGTGKSTLLRAVVGEVELDEGTVRLGTHVRIGYYDQQLRGLADDALVVDAIRPTHKEFTEPERRGLLARFGLTGDAAFQRVSSLSGGERSRAALARLAASDANFLVLDEPTNHLDFWACDALEQALGAFDGTVLLVSHDRYFLNRVVDHLLVVEPDRFRVLSGNYDTYVDTVRRRAAEAAQAPGETAAAGAGNSAPAADARRGRAEKPARPKRKFPYRKTADIEAEIAAHEQRIGELEREMILPENVRDGRIVRQFQTQIDELRAALERLYEHWQEALELNG